MLGSVEEKRIIELGAGIGRFTGALAATARSVTAVDFMEHLIKENERVNSHRSGAVRKSVHASVDLLVGFCCCPCHACMENCIHIACVGSALLASVSGRLVDLLPSMQTMQACEQVMGLICTCSYRCSGPCSRDHDLLCRSS